MARFGKIPRGFRIWIAAKEYTVSLRPPSSPANPTTKWRLEFHEPEPARSYFFKDEKELNRFGAAVEKNRRRIRRLEQLDEIYRHVTEGLVAEARRTPVVNIGGTDYRIIITPHKRGYKAELYDAKTVTYDFDHHEQIMDFLSGVLKRARVGRWSAIDKLAGAARGKKPKDARGKGDTADWWKTGGKPPYDPDSRSYDPNDPADWWKKPNESELLPEADYYGYLDEMLDEADEEAAQEFVMRVRKKAALMGRGRYARALRQLRRKARKHGDRKNPSWLGRALLSPRRHRRRSRSGLSTGRKSGRRRSVQLLRASADFLDTIRDSVCEVLDRYADGASLNPSDWVVLKEFALVADHFIQLVEGRGVVD